jgi:hypothetical protein
MKDFQIGKLTFKHWEESVSVYHNDVEYREHWDGEIEVTLGDLVADFGFTKRYLQEKVNYPVNDLPIELKLELLDIYNKIEKHIISKLPSNKI